jgi:hypothetical protein
VGDCNRHRVLLYDLAGHTLGAKPVHYLGKIIRGGRPGFPNESGAWFGPNGLHHTAGVAVHDDCIYAVGTDHDRVNIGSSEDVDTALVLGETAFPRFHLGRFEIGGGREKIELPRDDTNLKTPHGVAAGLGWLFISDRGNDRVLGWRLPIGARRQPASLVLGQADFTSKREPAVASRSSLNGPRDLAVDPQRKKLYVADYENHRVVRYDIAAFDRDVRDADLVLGQKDFDAAEPLATQDGLACPSALAVDPKSGRLFVGDWRTGAVTTFAPARASR